MKQKVSSLSPPRRDGTDDDDNADSTTKYLTKLQHKAHERKVNPKRLNHQSSAYKNSSDKNDLNFEGYAQQQMALHRRAATIRPSKQPENLIEPIPSFMLQNYDENAASLYSINEGAP